MGIMETVLEIPAEHEANVFGQFDAFAWCCQDHGGQQCCRARKKCTLTAS